MSKEKTMKNCIGLEEKGDSHFKENSHKGITLIALIITIIIMLLLVGVTISISLNGGLFRTAKDAVDKTELSKNTEMTYLLDEYNKYQGSNGPVNMPLPSDYYNGKKLVCIGDSITAGVGASSQEKRYVTLLGEYLGFANVSNFGASGTTLSTGGHRSSNFGKLTEANIAGADVVIIMMGINDWDQAVKNGMFNGNLTYDETASYYDLGTLGSNDTTTIYGATKMWCEKIKELQSLESCKETKFYFVTPIITSWNNSVGATKSFDQTKTNIHGYKLRDLCEAIIETCEQYKIPVFDMNLNSGIYYNSDSDNTTSLYFGDGIHPNDAGHQKIAEKLRDYILENPTYVEDSNNDNNNNENVTGFQFELGSNEVSYDSANNTFSGSSIKSSNILESNGKFTALCLEPLKVGDKIEIEYSSTENKAYTSENKTSWYPIILGLTNETSIATIPKESNFNICTGNINLYIDTPNISGVVTIINPTGDKGAFKKTTLSNSYSESTTITIVFERKMDGSLTITVDGTECSIPTSVTSLEKYSEIATSENMYFYVDGLSSKSSVTIKYLGAA